MKPDSSSQAPHWARDAVFYQIFLDRFANGDTGNDPVDVQPWESTPSTGSMMGGDLAGVIDRLDYLNDLGVNALYLGPVFAANSNHGYDTTDYHQIDPRLGTVSTLQDLVAKVHARGWHILLDGVFNHTGLDFLGFRSLLRDGEKSPYRNWYFPKRFPVQVNESGDDYAHFPAGVAMPKLNLNHPPARSYILDVATRWLHTSGIDGWRLDSVNEIDHDFWKEFREAVRKVNPDAYLVGEFWENGRDWLQGDEFDAVTNYRWRGAVLDFFASDASSPGEFDGILTQIFRDYEANAHKVLFNILDSHDTERIRTSCKGDRRRQLQTVLFQMTYQGTPCIYYGDEIGLEGGPDPDCRRCMIWDENRWDRDLHALYKRLIHIRRDYPALRHGEYHTVLTDDARGCYAYMREAEETRFVCVFNRSDQRIDVELPVEKTRTTALRDWLNAETPVSAGRDTICVSLPERGMALLGPK